jgi:DNA ligase 1
MNKLLLHRRHLLAWLMVSPFTNLAWAKNQPSVLLAQDYKAGIDPRDYLVSEKLDGVRALWDGKNLRFRSGGLIAAPAWFVAKLPAMPLDGELWLARGKFDELSGIVRQAQPDDAAWRKLSYQVFELPAAQGKGFGRFDERSQELRQLVQKTNWPQLQWVEQFKVTSAADLQAKLKAVVAQGGEGLMLHRIDAPVTTGRSPALLKLKPVSDAEGTVIAHVPGKGKHAGQLGALQIKTEDGQVFKLGTGLTDAQRQSPPPIGSTITYSYRDTTPSGKPRFASFVRVRELP